MLSYVAIAGSLAGVGHDRVVALVVDDGERTEVVGSDAVADDLRDVIAAGLDGDSADERLEHAVRGMSYFTVTGPHDFDGDLDALPALAAAYGLLMS